MLPKTILLLPFLITTNASAQQCVYDIFISSNDGFGRKLARLDDYDGDGIDDWIVGREFNGPGGAIQVRSGATGDLLWNLNWALSADRFGFDVANAGDVDGDGLEDYIVGAPEAGINGIQSGAAIVYSGATTNVIHQLIGDPGSLFGSSVGSLGDLNGDGRSELVVGSKGDDQGGNDSGRIVVLDGATGLVRGDYLGTTGDLFGREFANIGDLDGDSYDDLLVAAGVEFNPTSHPPYVHIISGQTVSWLSTHFQQVPGPSTFGAELVGMGDLDNDGFADYAISDSYKAEVYVFSGGTGTVMRTHSGTPGSWYGFGLDRIDDINGDGLPELVVGAPFEPDPDHPNDVIGAVFVYSGADGTELLRGYGNEEDELFGWSVLGLGDLSGSGLPHLLVGSPDDGRVQAFNPVPDLYRFCPSALNSTGVGATIDWLGSPSISTNNFRLFSRQCPAGQFGLFFYGPQEIAPAPFGDGFRCISGGLLRMPVQQASGSGIFFLQPFTVPAAQLHLVPGSTWSFQMWYRDPFGPGGTGYNSSEAMKVTFCP